MDELKTGGCNSCKVGVQFRGNYDMRDNMQVNHSETLNKLMWKFTTHIKVLQNQTGGIVHSINQF